MECGDESNCVPPEYSKYVSLNVKGHILKKHLIKLWHSLYFYEAALIHIKMIPLLIKIIFNIIIKSSSWKFFVFGEEFSGDLQAVLFIDPVLRKFSLSFSAAVAWAAAVHSALSKTLALSLQIKAAFAIASTIRIILTDNWVGFEDDSMAIKNQFIHKLVIILGKISDVNVWNWNHIIFHSWGGGTSNSQTLRQLLLITHELGFKVVNSLSSASKKCECQ